MEHTELARMGGKARAKVLTKAERSESARAAVNARWKRVRAARLLEAKKRGGRAGAGPHV
jgi:hypothetical protein